MYFEKENINKLDAKGEVLITIMASVAQQESEPISRDKKQALLIANATNEDKRRRLADIKAFLKGIMLSWRSMMRA
ncbi:hypothetical protein SAMN04487985_103137 [Aerococcus urinaehominis]|nr:hypothetical protein SAMN04487985_103137 [Aerococcus urinaehominis]